MRMVMAILMVLAIGSGLPASAQGRLTVQGVGQVTAVPDVARLSIGVAREAETAGEALAAVSDATAAILTRVARAGVAERDVQTGELSVQPRRSSRQDDAPPGIEGYVARNVLTLSIRDLDGLGPLIDASVAEGANQMSGLSFGLADPSDARDEARRRAVRDAMDRAAVLAETAGLALGDVVSLTEGMPARQPGPVFAMEEAMRSIPVALGEVAETITVTLVFDISPAG
jgi:uncharacterized protein YggE